MYKIIASAPRPAWEEIHNQPREVSCNEEPMSVGARTERIVQLYAKGSRYDPSAGPEVADIVGKVARDAPWQILKEKVTLPFIGTVLATPYLGFRPYGRFGADSLVLVTE